MATTTEVDVLIIGAGLSGLSAALFLQDNHPDVRFLVLEASGRVGGRTLTDTDGTDLGAGYIGPGQDHIMRLVDRYKLELVKVPTAGKTCQSIRGVVKHYEGTIPPISPLATLDLNRALIVVEDTLATINPDDPSQSPNAKFLDSVSCEEYINKILIPGSAPWKADARAVLATALKAVLCVSPSEVSALGFLWYVRTNGGTKRIFETKDGLQDSKVYGGVGRVAELVAQEINSRGASRKGSGTDAPENRLIQLNTAVRRIDTSDSSYVRVHTTDTTEAAAEKRVKGKGSSGQHHPAPKCFLAKKVILAIPPMQQLRIEYFPALPPNRLQALQRWPMGHIIKTFTYYETPFWREKSLNGSGVGDKGISLVCMDDTKRDNSMPGLMGFILADQAVEWSQKSLDQRMEAMGKHYAELFQDPRALKPIRYKDKVWAEEPWVGGCYVGVPAVGALTTYASRAVLTAPLGPNLHVAGTETARKSVGYMDGAVESGERSARNVLIELGKIKEVTRFNKLEVPDPSPQMPRTVIPITAAERLLPTSTQLLYGMLACVALGAALYHGRNPFQFFG
jgi:monoamine oxidase